MRLCLQVWASLGVAIAGAISAEPLPEGGALSGERFRVVISTDAGGSDEDDLQSLVHYLVYADLFDTEGLISSPPSQGRAADIAKVISIYAKDYPALRRYGDTYPEPESLLKLVKQGATEPSPKTGHSEPTEGSRWIIERAKASDERPLWILVWGSITDVAQAVHDAPEIKDRIRIYDIASWNREQDPNAFRYLDTKHPDLWMIQCETTFRGWYQGGDQEGDLDNRSFVETHLRGHGALGDYFAGLKAAGVSAGSIKMGDTPSVAYLLRGDANDPTSPSWGGQFQRREGRPNWFVDRPESDLAQGSKKGARTVNRWREAFLRDWQQRMDRCLPAK
ncbi:MAG: DUF1593 domain-containing protein [Verrucomicrobiae bacterium]|nr:DUF1593 domain-containing protein [Verrucomicrobiae bacterium]